MNSTYESQKNVIFISMGDILHVCNILTYARLCMCVCMCLEYAYAKCMRVEIHAHGTRNVFINIGTLCLLLATKQSCVLRIIHSYERFN